MSVRRTYQFAITPHWVIFHPDLNATAVHVFAALDSYADRASRETWVGMAALAERLGCSEGTVRNAVRSLSRVGAVVVHPRFDSDGRQTSNLYQLAGDSPLAPALQDSVARTLQDSVGRTLQNFVGNPEPDDPEPEGTSVLHTATTSQGVAKRSRARSERDDLWDVMCDCLGIDADRLTKSQKADLAKSRNEVFDAGGRATDVAPRVREWMRRYREVVPTHRVLRQHWASLGTTFNPPKKPDVMDRVREQLRAEREGRVS